MAVPPTQLRHGSIADLADTFSFDDDARAIRIHRHDTPQPWINYLSNGSFHAFASQAGGGFAWWKSPMIYKLTRYRQHNLPIDSPGFYVYIRRPDGVVWSPTFRPCETPLDRWEACHQPGKTTYTATKDGLTAILTLFVAPDHDVLVWDLCLQNETGDAQDLDVFAYVENSQLGWANESHYGYYVKLQLKTWYNPENRAVNYLFHHADTTFPEVSPLVYLAGSHPVASYSGSRQGFMGNYRDERNPQGVERGDCGGQVISCGEPAAAIHNRVRLSAGGQERLHVFLGVAPGALVDQAAAEAAQAATLAALRSPGVVDAQLAKLDAWWADQFAAYQCELPDPMASRQINTWSVINSVHTGRYSRSVNTVAPGVRGVGFRDTAQDLLAVAYRRPQWAAEGLRLLLRYQYRDGHTVHMAHPETGAMPGTSRHSDDHLWLHLVAYAIISETGDPSLLDESVPYLADDHLSQDGAGTIWEHLITAIRYTEANLGKHGLPLTMASDWNDIIGRFNRRGEGETVFACQQYVLALRRMVELAAYAGRAEGDWLADCRDRAVAALEAHAWDGRWWLRGFDDDGNPVGSETCAEGKLFLNPQSWAVISGTGSPTQHRQGLDAAAERLDTGIGLKLLDPSFADWKIGDSDASMGYGPGCGENGAIFCHANTWAIIAEALAGNPASAWKYFTQLIPANAMATVGLESYRAEPYAWVSNIVGPENPAFGWANVEQITGTAPWMDVAATQYLLGVRPTLDGLIIDPCLLPDWPSVRITRRFRGCDLTIAIHNPAGTGRGVIAITIDGEPLAIQDGPLIPAHRLTGRDQAIVVVILGD